MNDQKPSASTSGQQQKMDKPMNQDENQVQVEHHCFIVELPPEMLMKILKHLNLENLLVSRLVSRKWNEMARAIIKSSDDVETVFNCYRPNPTERLRIIGKSGKYPFPKFLECFNNESNSNSNYNKENYNLYTSFRFNCAVLSLFNCVNFIKFISDYGENIKSLKLVFKSHFDSSNYFKANRRTDNNNDQDLKQIAGKLGDLLLNKLPNLQEFGIQFNIPDTGNSWEIELFPTTTTSTLNEETTIQLPKLKVLYLSEDSFSKQAGIITDLLRASINLQKIELFKKDDSYESIQTFEWLQSLGKLHCLQDVKIEPTPQFLFTLGEMSTIPLVFKLKTLKLQTSSISKVTSIWSDASSFLSDLFKSSKDSLRDLKTNSMGFLPNLQLVKFSTLISLCFYGGCEWNLQALPSEVKLMEIFPALQHLDLQLEWTKAFPQIGPDFCIPTLTTLQVIQDGMNAPVITQISAVCPNLKSFKINGKLLNFPEVGTAIWTHMESLQSLDLKIEGESRNAFPAVDSCITGFSKDDCIRLYELIENDELLKKGGSSMFILQSEFVAERKHPSILDLKDLKELAICLDWYNTRSEESAKKILAVSERCVLKLMDNLGYRKTKSYFPRS